MKKLVTSIITFYIVFISALVIRADQIQFIDGDMINKESTATCNLENIQVVLKSSQDDLSQDDISKTNNNRLSLTKKAPTKKNNVDVVSSNNKNSPKAQYKAGTNIITIPLKKGVLSYQDGILTQTSNLITTDENNKVIINENEVIINNNKILAANNSIVQTSGGTSNIVKIYPTLDDIKEDSNGIAIDGGANEGKYFGTIKINDEYYFHVNISGLDGYISQNDAQIIPMSLVKSYSYYENIDGDWYFNIANDPLISTQYQQLYMGTAPNGSIENTKYYSLDGENYYLSPNSNQNSDKLTGANYFKNLQFRTSSNYKGSDYQNYLKSVGHSNSKYYKYTNAFVEAQEKYNINSLFLFAFANHESAYGTSNLAKTCNAYFGRGAFDSDPDNACKDYGWSDARSSILAQAIFLSQEYADVMDSKYSGTNVGDKNSGLNVHYASDPNWGSKIASMMASIDNYLGAKEVGKFKIIELTKSTPVYVNNSLKTVLKQTRTSGIYNYKIAKNGKAKPKVIVTDETSNALKIQLDMPLYNGKNSNYYYTYAKKGSYPNYEGKNQFVPVTNRTGSFAIEYGSYASNEYWISKNNYKILNNVTAVAPKDYKIDPKDKVCSVYVRSDHTGSGNKEKFYVSPNGEYNCRYIYLKDDTSKRISYTKWYLGENRGSAASQELSYYNDYNPKKIKNKEYLDLDGTGHILKTKFTKYSYNSANKLYQKDEKKYNGTKEDGLKTAYTKAKVSTSTGKTTSYITYIYNKVGTRIQRIEKTYYSNGKSRTYYNYMYDNNLNLINREANKYLNTGVKKYYANTKYTKNKIASYKEYFYNSSGKRIQRNEKIYSNGKSKNYYRYYYTSTNKYIRREKYLFDKMGHKTYYANTNYSNHKIVKYKEYKYNSKGIRIQRNEKYYYSNGKANYKKYYYYDSKGKYKSQRVVFY